MIILGHLLYRDELEALKNILAKYDIQIKVVKVKGGYRRVCEIDDLEEWLPLIIEESKNVNSYEFAVHGRRKRMIEKITAVLEEGEYAQ